MEVTQQQSEMVISQQHGIGLNEQDLHNMVENRQFYRNVQDVLDIRNGFVVDENLYGGEE